MSALLRINSLFSVVLCGVMVAATMPANLVWETEVVASDPHDSSIIYSLVAVGSFRGHWSANFRSVRDEWLKNHSRASLVQVCEYPGSERVPNSRIVFVWIVDGKDNLVIDLIRHGCLLADYVKAPEKLRIKISPSAYSGFLEEAATAERAARAANLGVWAERDKQSGDD